MEVPIEILYPNDNVTMNDFIVPGKPTIGDKWLLTPNQLILLETIVKAAEDEEHGFYLLPNDLKFFKRILEEETFKKDDILMLRCVTIHYFNHRHSDIGFRAAYPMELHKNLHYGIK